ncbi:hypothetical protein BJX64DRAFT_290678 [Aspergillus heterothallicus]
MEPEVTSRPIFPGEESLEDTAQLPNPDSTGSRFEECYASSTCWGFPWINHDCRERRHKRSSRQAVAGTFDDGFIDEDLRVGGPYMCRIPAHYIALPRTHKHYHRLVVDADEIIFKIIEILFEANIKPISVDFVGRLSEVETEPAPRLTLLIFARRESLDPIWIYSARKLWRLLNAQFIYLDVEIADPRAFTRLEVFDPRDIDDEILATIEYDVWNDIRGTQYEDTVTSIGVRRITDLGFHTDAPVTLAISILPDSDISEYRPLRERMVRLLNFYRLYEVAVMIIRGEPETLLHSKHPMPDYWSDF